MLRNQTTVTAIVIGIAMLCVAAETGEPKHGVVVGAVDDIDAGAKTIAVKTADGAKETYHLTERSADEIGKGVAKGGEKTVHGTAYVTDEAGHKVVHFFERAF